MTNRIKDEIAPILLKVLFLQKTNDEPRNQHEQRFENIPALNTWFLSLLNYLI